MTAATLPDLAPVDLEDDAVNHIYCCNPDLSLCGLDISQHEDVTGRADLRDECPPCGVAWDLVGPCAAPECRRGRKWWWPW